MLKAQISKIQFKPQNQGMNLPGTLTQQSFVCFFFEGGVCLFLFDNKGYSIYRTLFSTYKVKNF